MTRFKLYQMAPTSCHTGASQTAHQPLKCGPECTSKLALMSRVKHNAKCSSNTGFYFIVYFQTWLSLEVQEVEVKLCSLKYTSPLWLIQQKVLLNLLVWLKWMGLSHMVYFNTHVSPLCHMLAIWGLMGDDIGVLSIRGNNTGTNVSSSLNLSWPSTKPSHRRRMRPGSGMSHWDILLETQTHCYLMFPSKSIHTDCTWCWYICLIVYVSHSVLVKLVTQPWSSLHATFSVPLNHLPRLTDASMKLTLDKLTSPWARLNLDCYHGACSWTSDHFKLVTSVS